MENFDVFNKAFCMLLLLLFQQAYAIFEFPVELSSISQEDLSKLKSLDNTKLLKSIELGVESIDRQERLENNLVSSNIIVQNGTISHAHLLETLPSGKARHDNEVARKILQSSLYILNTECLQKNVNAETCESIISNIPLPPSELLDDCLSINNKSRNGHHAFRRLLPAKYKDGFFQMYSNLDLPKPREISSMSLHNNIEHIRNGNLAEDSNSKNIALIQWTQFIEQDLSKSVVTSMKQGYPIECCNSNFYKLAPRYVHPACAPLEGVTKNEYQRVPCLNYVRSVLAVDPKCTFGAAEQLNQATGYLDLSQLYGYTKKAERKMRTYTDGKLRVSRQSMDRRPFLPFTQKKDEFCAMDQNSNDTCFMAGDSRVNSNPFMIMLYTIFLRSHNQYAEKLKSKYPKWDDKRLYQVAKRRNVKAYRCIVFKEWLPTAIGNKNANKIMSEKLQENSHHIDYQVSNEFAIAAIRFYHSMMPNVLQQEYFNKIQYNSAEVDLNTNSIHPPTKLFALKDEYYKSDFLMHSNRLDKAFNALLSQKAMKMDSSYADSVIKEYLSTKDSASKISGSDALAWDIQRGRDHGLQGYTKYLEICAKQTINNWEDLNKYIRLEDINKLKQVYKDVNDIDLIIGGISEIPEQYSTVGPTFSCILGEQFSKMRKWHYNLDNDNGVNIGDESFKTDSYCSGAKLLCMTTDLVAVPSNIFLVPSDTNPMVECRDIVRSNNFN